VRVVLHLTNLLVTCLLGGFEHAVTGVGIPERQPEVRKVAESFSTTNPRLLGSIGRSGVADAEIGARF
jgi:hypothetical protein